MNRYTYYAAPGNPMHVLENRHVEVRYQPRLQDIYVRMNNDYGNERRAYNIRKRGAEKAFTALEKQFTEELTFAQVFKVLDGLGLRMHAYCGLD